jgi:hypothetical protein
MFANDPTRTSCRKRRQNLSLGTDRLRPGALVRTSIAAHAYDQVRDLPYDAGTLLCMLLQYDV